MTGFNQFDVDDERVRKGLGSNACLSIVGQVGAMALKCPAEVTQFLLGGKELRKMTLDCVRSWDERDDTGALEAVAYLPVALHAAGCSSLRHRVVVLPTHNPARLAQILCADAQPFVIALTAQKQTEHIRGDSVSDSFVVVAAGGEFAVHDSHIGRTVIVHGCDMLAAQTLAVLLYNSVLPQMKCGTAQLELVVCDMGVPLCAVDACRPARKGCDYDFLKVFVPVARKILGTWSCPLHDMGDVACTTWEYHRIKAKWASQDHLMPQWFLGSLFFYLHSWRFSDCMRDFATACVEDATLWCEQDESALERALQIAMPAICKQAYDTFQTVMEAQDPRFLVERPLVPRNALCRFGGYSLGPHSWPHADFPFAAVGKAMCKALDSPGYVDKNFSQIRKELRESLPVLSVLGSEGKEQKLGRYILTHKLRTLLAAEGMVGTSVGFCGGVDMSPKNAATMAKLGLPSPEECQYIFGCRVPPLECGFHICFVGQLISTFLGSMPFDEVKVRELLSNLDTLDWKTPVVAATAMCDRGDVLPRWEEMTWHSPVQKLVLACGTAPKKCGEEFLGASRNFLGGDNDNQLVGRQDPGSADQDVQGSANILEEETDNEFERQDGAPRPADDVSLNHLAPNPAPNACGVEMEVQEEQEKKQETEEEEESKKRRREVKWTEEEEEGAEGGAEGAEKKERHRRSKQEMQPPDMDVALQLMDLVPRLLKLREELDEVVRRGAGEDLFEEAQEKRNEVSQVGALMLKLPVCPCCWMEVPCAMARSTGRESWRYHSGHIWCSFCGGKGKKDFTQAHMDLVRVNLRRRVRAEAEMALELGGSAADKKETGDLKAALAGLEISFGHGGGPKGKDKTLEAIWLVAQIGRTLGRLLLEPSLMAERLVLLRALRYLKVH